MSPRGPRMRAMAPIFGMSAGVPITLSKLMAALPFSLMSAMSSTPPTKSAPAAVASSASKPSANTATRTCLPVPCGSEAAPRTIWSDRLESTPSRTEMSMDSLNLALELSLIESRAPARPTGVLDLGAASRGTPSVTPAGASHASGSKPSRSSSKSYSSRTGAPAPPSPPRSSPRAGAVSPAADADDALTYPLEPEIAPAAALAMLRAEPGAEKHARGTEPRAGGGVGASASAAAAARATSAVCAPPEQLARASASHPRLLHDTASRNICLSPCVYPCLSRSCVLCSAAVATHNRFLSGRELRVLFRLRTFVFSDRDFVGARSMRGK
mmetsp:Transcript_13161/g.43402  ORF Transcript_13161/g.43402 Transcript_13161/m.43402 type:complete len:327 (+) Transcript_13161:1065-2045(+)